MVCHRVVYFSLKLSHLIIFRAAATRCREKRKLWIQALEKKAEEMSDLNSQLQVSCVLSMNLKLVQ